MARLGCVDVYELHVWRELRLRGARVIAQQLVTHHFQVDEASWYASQQYPREFAV